MTEPTAKDDFRDFREHSRAAIRALCEGWRTLVPEGFLEKGRESQKEALRAVRSLIDVALDRLEGQAKEQGKPTPKQKIKVEPE
jgi:hypothetical protein